MIFIVTPETVMVDVTHEYRAKLAAALRIPVGMVSVNWEVSGKDLRPRVDLEFPPSPPPADLDVNDPAALAQWEAEVQEMPTMRAFLADRGITEPEKVISLYMQLLAMEARARVDVVRAAL